MIHRDRLAYFTTELSIHDFSLGPHKEFARITQTLTGLDFNFWVEACDQRWFEDVFSQVDSPHRLVVSPNIIRVVYPSDPVYLHALAQMWANTRYRGESINTSIF